MKKAVSSCVVGKICKDCGVFIVGTNAHSCLSTARKDTKNVYPNVPYFQTISPSFPSGSDSRSYIESYNDINSTSDEPEENRDIDDSANFNLTSQLIIEIEKRRPLWDYRLPKEERYPNIVNKLWEEIVKELNCTLSAKDLEKKFAYLKDQYRRIKSKQNNKVSGSKGGKPQKPWIHFNSLMFLDDIVLIKNKTQSNIKEYKNDIDDMADLLNKNVETGNTNIKKLKKSDSNLDKLGDALLEELKHSRPLPVEKSPDMAFCNYIADLMSEIPQKKKRKLQGEIISFIMKELND